MIRTVEENIKRYEDLEATAPIAMKPFYNSLAKNWRALLSIKNNEIDENPHHQLTLGGVL